MFTSALSVLSVTIFGFICACVVHVIYTDFDCVDCVD